MNRYRVVLTFEARDSREAAAIISEPGRLPRDARMVIIDADRRRTLRYAAFIGGTIAFWLAVATGLVHIWRNLPQ